MLRSLRNAFITGIIVVLPLGVTIIVINFLLERLGTPASNFFFWYLDPEWRSKPIIEFGLEAISVLVVFLLITLLGYGSRFVIGRIILSGLERLLDQVPFINAVYRTVKQIVDTFGQQKKAVFQEVVLIEYPRKRCYVLGFLTSSARGETQEVTGEHIVNIFVPTTPNPTSGFLLMLPEEDVIHLSMSITDGMKLIISGGALVPNPKTGESVQIENPRQVKGQAPVDHG
ncbi:DUF502 domain-containing protein [Coraliomargarita algicola]|uniref:DUF502 domain-containing protein n=1 Tax=Coraliomargarita algicola TaxID=3092156 RepID=A0ABZ0RER9_9BACT|nr:DUF502 domain-containing protein [Coraliomargarita sp. J2-16]WPJ94526.1 DUF502 domain-containing protein [Coraliomargarita sp. J2-16]